MWLNCRDRKFAAVDGATSHPRSSGSKGGWLTRGSDVFVGPAAPPLASGSATR